MSSKVRVQRSGNPSRLTKQLQRMVIVRIVQRRQPPAVTFQNLHHRRKQLTDIRHTSLDSFAHIHPPAINILIVCQRERPHVRVSQPREHLEHEQVLRHRYLRTSHRSQGHESLHLILRQILHVMLIAALKLPPHLVVRVSVNLPKQHGSVQQSLQTLVVRKNPAIGDTTAILALQRVQPSVPLIQTLRGQVRPSTQHCRLAHTRQYRLIMLQCIGTHAKKRQLALDPLANLVGTHIRHCRLLLTNHDSPNLGHVDRQPTVHATVNLRVGPVQHPAQPIVQRVRVRTVSDTVQRPLTQSQPDTRRDIIRLPLISETNLHHARLLPRGLLLTVKDTSRSTHNSFFFFVSPKKIPASHTSLRTSASLDARGSVCSTSAIHFSVIQPPDIRHASLPTSEMFYPFFSRVKHFAVFRQKTGRLRCFSF